MKKILLLLCLSYLQDVEAQNKNNCASKPDMEVIEIDMEQPSKNKFPKAVKEGSLIYIKFNNINPFIAKADLKIESEAFQFDVPKFQSEVQDDKKNGINKKPLDSLLPGPAGADKNAQQKALAQFLSSYQQFKNEIEKINNLGQFEKIVKNSLKEATITGSTLKPRLAKYYNTFFTENEGAVEGYMLFKLFKNTLTSASASYVSLKSLYQILNASSLKDDNPVTIKGTLKEKKTGVVYEVQFEKTQKNTKSLLLEEEFKWATEKMNLLNKDSIRNAYTKTLHSTSELIDKINSSTFEVTTGPYTAKDDYFILSGQIKDTSNKIVYTFPEKIKIPITGGFRSNISAGLSVDFGNFRKRTYRIETITDSSLRISEYKSTDGAVPKIVALTHFYCKKLGMFTPALTLGVSPNLNDLLESRMHLGGSLLVGEKEKWVLSTGLTGGRSERLKAEYIKGQTYSSTKDKTLYTEISGLKDADLYTKSFNFGFFFSISYNISKTSKESSR